MNGAHGTHRLPHDLLTAQKNAETVQLHAVSMGLRVCVLRQWCRLQQEWAAVSWDPELLCVVRRNPCKVSVT